MVGRKAPASRRDPLSDFIQQGTRSLALKVDKTWVPGVAVHLSVALRHSGLVERFALSEETDPASVFKS
jgi:hypothetical protein